MAFDLWIVCLIGCAIVMFMVSLVQDLIASLRRRHERATAAVAQLQECPGSALAWESVSVTAVGRTSARILPIYAHARTATGASIRFSCSREDPTREAVA